MAGPLPDEAVSVIERLAEGSPFMAAAALRGLVESGALVPADPAAGGKEWGDGASSRWPWPTCSPRATPPLSSRAASSCCRRRPSSCCRSARCWARSSICSPPPSWPGQRQRKPSPHSRRPAIGTSFGPKGKDSQCVFIHDKLRETLLDRLPDQRAPGVAPARRAAISKASRPERVYDLAYHFDAAGENSTRLALCPGRRRSRPGSSTPWSLPKSSIASRSASVPADQATRYQIAEGLGDVLMLRGRYEEAARQTEAARRAGRWGHRQGADRRQARRTRLQARRHENGDRGHRTCLELLGHKVPQWSGGVFVSSAFGKCSCKSCTPASRVFSWAANKSSRTWRSSSSSIRLHNRLTYAYWFGRGQDPLPLDPPARHEPGRAAILPRSELAQAYSIHAPVMSLMPYFSRGIAYAQKSFAIYKSLGDLWGQGQSLHFMASSSMWRRGSRSASRNAARRCGCWSEPGTTGRSTSPAIITALSLYRLGDLAGAVAEARRIHRSGLELGDIQASGDSASTCGCGPPAARSIRRRCRTELQRPREDVRCSAQVMLAEGVRLFMLDRVEEAAAVFEKAHQLAEQAGVKNAYVFPPLRGSRRPCAGRPRRPPNWTPGRPRRPCCSGRARRPESAEGRPHVSE